MLEGGRLIGPTLTNTYECKYIPDCPDMDEEVQALHDLARNGVISADTAERQINMYLLVASHRKVAHGLPPERLRWLLLPITDVPCVGLLPDLGQLIHRILTRDPLQSAISRIMEQCIPSMRHVSRAAYTYQDSHDILLTLVQALLFGTFPNVSKKPGFVTRVALWRRMHYLLTASRQEQTAFLEGHQDMLYLASMEYIARVVPVYMPAQDAFLTGRDAVSAPFFRRIPPLCDEFRQLVDDAIQDESASHTPMTWARMQELCAGYVERVSRLKRSHASSSSGTHTGGGGGGKDAVRDPIPRGPLPNIIDYWSVPQLHGNPSRDEFRLLGLSLGLNGSVIMQIQRDLQISLLPENLRRLQIQRLLAHSGGEMRTLFLRTRRYICMHCMLTSKTHHTHRLRLDTLDQNLVCAACMKSDLMQINLLGRVLRFKQHHFYLCPVCISIQQYMGRDEQPWLSCPRPEAGGVPWTCPHMPGTLPAASSRKRRLCFICTEAAVGPSIERVDHLTGVVHSFLFCQRHTPRVDILLRCVNARQMAAYDPVCRRGCPPSGMIHHPPA